MAMLANEFRWSITRSRCFDTCKRQYYYQYYGRWNGWEANASAVTRQCYMLSKMTTLPTLAGTIVHQCIKWLLQSIARGSPLSLDELKRRALTNLRAAWVQSERKDWRRSPKRYTNLFEHYYGVEVTAANRRAIRDRVFHSLAAFVESETLKRICQAGPGAWKPIEQFQRFSLDGLPVGLMMDFAAEIDGRLEIYDWKTGGEDESHAEQVICYALYAEREWGYQPEGMVVKLFYLEQEEPEPMPVVRWQLGAMAAQIVTSANKMLAMLVDPENNIAEEGDFPRNETVRRCKRCSYQELCHGGPVGAV